MSVNNIFEYATRNKVRFPYKGLITVEDLWDLDVNSLDKIFKVLNSQAKQLNEESLLDEPTKEDELINAQIKIIKYIVGVKLAEKEAREIAKIKKEQKQKIMSIIATKQDEELQNTSIEDLQKMLDKLGE